MKMNSSIKILYSVCKAELITEQATCRIIERYRIKKYETQLEQLHIIIIIIRMECAILIILSIKQKQH